jgi:hypothetical protein
MRQLCLLVGNSRFVGMKSHRQSPVRCIKAVLPQPVSWFSDTVLFWMRLHLPAAERGQGQARTGRLGLFGLLGGYAKTRIRLPSHSRHSDLGIDWVEVPD